MTNRLQNSSIQHKHNHSDLYGMIISMLCVIHCVSMPLVIIALNANALLGNILNHYFELIILSGSLYFVGQSFYKTFYIHRSLFPIILAGIGFFCLFYHIIFLHDHNLSQMPWVSIIGGILICISHLLNFKIFQLVKINN